MPRWLSVRTKSRRPQLTTTLELRPFRSPTMRGGQRRTRSVGSFSGNADALPLVTVKASRHPRARVWECTLTQRWRAKVSAGVNDG